MNGKLGMGDMDAVQPVPAQLPQCPQAVVDVSCGDFHSCCLTGIPFLCLPLPPIFSCNRFLIPSLLLSILPFPFTSPFGYVSYIMQKVGICILGERAIMDN